MVVGTLSCLITDKDSDKVKTQTICRTESYMLDAVVGVNRRHSTPAEDVLGPRNIRNSKINYRQEIRAVNESINYLVQQYEISYLSSSFKKGQPQGNPKTLDRYVKVLIAKLHPN
ncbi:hypothetical protein J6590_035628 [Homalodisca vitripennis]|nr:hypothetical protein J6590_035628 [Homalodisca vitripennis]